MHLLSILQSELKGSRPHSLFLIQKLTANKPTFPILTLPVLGFVVALAFLGSFFATLLESSDTHKKVLNVGDGLRVTLQDTTANNMEIQFKKRGAA